MAEAMNQIRSELGNNAVILNSKVVYNGGFLGLFKKKGFEVIAAIDPNVQVAEQKIYTKETHQSANQLPVKKEEPDSNKIIEELNEMKELLLKQRPVLSNRFEHYPLQLKQLSIKLTDMELEDTVIDQLMVTLLHEWQQNGSEKGVTDAELIEKVKLELAEKLTSITPVHPELGKRYINIVGPTGVGKTTTVAKMAAEYVIKKRKKVAFITTDTYRIAAIEQLKTYAQILSVPIEVAYNLADFKKAADRFSHYDHVFIDTAGRNFRNKEYVEELQKLIDFDREMETYLVLAVTSKEKDMETIFSQFSLIPLQRLIFTKTDETVNHGSIINFILKHQMEVAYLTNGQNVPDDIVKASPREIVNIVFGGQ